MSTATELRNELSSLMRKYNVKLFRGTSGGEESSRVRKKIPGERNGKIFPIEDLRVNRPVSHDQVIEEGDGDFGVVFVGGLPGSPSENGLHKNGLIIIDETADIDWNAIKKASENMGEQISHESPSKGPIPGIDEFRDAGFDVIV